LYVSRCIAVRPRDKISAGQGSREPATRRIPRRPGRSGSQLMGMPVDDDGTNHAEDLTSACRHAVLNMIDLLQERGFSRQQAYVVCSVAVDLRISNVVDVPNYVVSALLPEDIFVS
jgi:acetamidase/formamidase